MPPRCGAWPRRHPDLSDAMRRAGHADGNALFDAILSQRSGVTFTVHEYADDWSLIGHDDHKIVLVIPNCSTRSARFRRHQSP